MISFLAGWNLIKSGVLQKYNPKPTTIIVYLIFISKYVTNLSPVTFTID